MKFNLLSLTLVAKDSDLSLILFNDFSPFFSRLRWLWIYCISSYRLISDSDSGDGAFFLMFGHKGM